MSVVVLIFFFNAVGTSGIRPSLFVGSVSCVEETGGGGGAQDYDAAQELFLKSTRPVTALEMRKDLKHWDQAMTVSYTHFRAHETVLDLVCRLLLEKKKSNVYQLLLSLPLILI